MGSTEEDWARLLRASNAGDGAAYAAFLRAIAGPIRGLVRAKGRTLGAEACEDIVQETLLAIHAKRHTWRDDAPVRPWLWAIARHKVADAFRARGARIHLPVEDFVDDLAAPEADPTAAHDVGGLLARLDARSAAIVRAVVMEGRGAAEAGLAHAMTEGAVRVALHRAMGRLRAFVEGGR